MPLNIAGIKTSTRPSQRSKTKALAKMILKDFAKKRTYTKGRKVFGSLKDVVNETRGKGYAT